MMPGIVILAAGGSTRMGTPKQLLAYGGTTLLGHAVETARSIDGAPVVVVLGAHAAEIRASTGDPGLIFAENPGWRRGMGSSLRTGLAALVAGHPDVPAAIFMLCDQPLVSPETLAGLVAAHEEAGRPIVASRYAGTLGVPALFARALFAELLVCGDHRGGAQRIIRARRDQAIGVPFEHGAVDIDTPAEYEALAPPPTDRPSNATSS